MGNRGVLVVDDEKDIREILQEALELIGHRVYTASDGREALQVLEKIERPDLILLDLMMPGMDGSEFFRAKQSDARFSEIPVVIVSADCNVEEKSRAMGATAFIQKPIELHELLRIAEGLGVN